MKLTDKEISKNLPTLPGWEYSDGQIQKTFNFKNFKEALSFVNKVGDLAEKAGHHPDINILYNKVVLKLSTHTEAGITEKDINLARAIENLVI